MTTPEGRSLLGHDEPGPVIEFNSEGRSPFLLLGDHAGKAIPRRLGTLGLSSEDRARHIALDIGVRELGALLAKELDAVFLHQHYSRLVIDCNRDPLSEQAMAAISDGSRIPGNEALSADERAARIEAVHKPYHDRIAAELRRRDAEKRQTILIALHSFTPIMADIARPWHVGVLHSEGDIRFATALLRALGAVAGIVVGDNEPYRMDDTDYSIPRHAFAEHRPYVELEVRQDLIGNGDLRRVWHQKLCIALRSALGGYVSRPAAI
jgi:predicted N-formylglutamate amidohydrolase